MDYVKVVEAAYRLDGSLDEWLRGLVETSAPWFDVGLGCFAHVFRVQERGISVDSVAGGGILEGMEPMIRQASESAPIDAVRIMFDAGVVAGSAVDALEPHGLAIPFQRLISETSGGAMRDQVGVVASDGEGRGIALGGGRSHRATPSRSSTARWTRVAAHIGAGCRLLRRLSAGADPDGDAVLGADGKIHHAEGDARHAAESLRRAVLATEKARGPLRRRAPDEALELWTGLVDGRWSLIDRFDTDGRRFIVAHRNHDHHADPRGLTSRELSVVERLGRGRSAKEVAYELGVSTSAVVNTTGRARKKLGLATTTELAAFFAPGGLRSRLSRLSVPGLAGDEFAAGALPPVELDCLSEAEAGVALALLRGATTEAIAAERGSSASTVTNHIARIFAKFGVNSRNELASKLYSAEASAQKLA